MKLNRALIGTPLLALSLGLTLSACYPRVRSERTETVYTTAAVPPMTDEMIVTNLRSRILADPGFAGLNIGVASYQGVVSLNGAVHSGLQADQVIRVARETPGVREVRPNLIVE